MNPNKQIQSLQRGILLLLLNLLLLTPMALADKLERLVITGPPAAVSFPLVYMVANGALDDLAEEVVFTPWRDPDQLRVQALGNQAQVLAMPTNVAANLYNRGTKLQLLNVSTWGVLWIVSRDPSLKNLSDLRGKEIAMPFRADMPDIIFQALTRAQGLDPRRDFKLRYVSNPLDAMQLLIMRRVDHALLAEPAVSMALRRTQSFPASVVAPDLHRGIDLQKEWGQVFSREAQIPQAGIVIMGTALENPELAKRIQSEYRKALNYCLNHPFECSQMVAGRLDMLMPAAIEDALGVSQLKVVVAAEAKDDLEFLFELLMADNPALVGGKLPDNHFYGIKEP